MSGVKNLRAMFEQKNDQGNSPPDRGRSPGPGLPSFGSPTSNSSRPLSKVRTNFIAVEKDGRVGLRREHSGDSVSTRRLSNETESTTPAPVPDKNDPFTETMATKPTLFKTNLTADPIPESPVTGSPGKLSPKKGTETPEITPCPNPDKIVDEEESKTRLTTADPTVKSEPAPPKGPQGTSNRANGSPEVKHKAKSTITATKPAPKTATPISTSAKTTSKPLRSPLASKAPKSPAKESAPVKTTERKPATPAVREATPKAAAPKSAVSSGKKPSTLEVPAATGFAKPKSKSPTRPVHLPSRLTAPTTASASKLGKDASPPAQSQPRTPGNTSFSATNSQRPASRAAASTAGSATSGKTLRRQASTINRPRPSLGLPPKPVAKDHPPVRKEAQVDESFLARMMRPTQSSSNKSSDKAPITPPRKQAVPTTVKKSATEGSAKKAAARIAESVKKDGSVKKPVVAKAEVKKVASAEAIAKEAAPVATQAGSANVPIKGAETSDHTAASTPLVETEPVPKPAPAADTVEGAATESAAIVEEVTDDIQTTEKDILESHEPEPMNAVEPTSEVPPALAGIAIGNDTELENEKKSEDVPDAKAEGEALAEKDNVPAIAADPEKVEDMEDVVRGLTDLSVSDKAE